MLTVGSLFSGAGLLDCGLHQAGIQHAWFVERDEFRRGLLARRWPGVPVSDDVRTAGAATLAPVDGIVGGFPCKGASSAGKRTGFAHPETALWSEFERIVRELRPRYVLVENVRDILALHRGEVWGTVLGDLAALGYDVAWDCIPASAIGAPHGRDRVFAVAHAQDGRWAAAADAGEPGGMGRHPGAATSAAADADASCGRAGTERAAPRPDGGGRQDGEAAGGGGPGPVPGSVVCVCGYVIWPGDRWCGRCGRMRPATTDADRTPGRQLPGHAPSPQGQDGRRPAQLDHEPRGAGQGGIPTAVEWGEYEPAIRRWEAIHGPAPAPLTDVRRLDDGDAKLRRMRARVDRSRLSALGDGVHVYVGRLLGEALMALAEADRA